MQTINLRAFLNFAFESTASKYCSERGRRREHSQSYVTDAQRSAEQYLPQVGRSVKFKQALKFRYTLSLLAAIFCLHATALLGQNTLQIRNCSNNIIKVKSYNEWDKKRIYSYPGQYGSAVINQINSILAENGGNGETATL